MTTPTKIKPVTDRQLTGLAGEFFVAAQLLKLGLQTSITLGAAKQIDLFAYNPRTGKDFRVQVKTLRAANYFPLEYEGIDPEQMYVFVLLNDRGASEQYYVVSGRLLKNEPARFGESLRWDVRPGVHPRVLDSREFKDNWDEFLEPSSDH